jgi:hypothetical protein
MSVAAIVRHGANLRHLDLARCGLLCDEARDPAVAQVLAAVTSPRLGAVKARRLHARADADAAALSRQEDDDDDILDDDDDADADADADDGDQVAEDAKRSQGGQTDHTQARGRAAAAAPARSLELDRIGSLFAAIAPLPSALRGDLHANALVPASASPAEREQILSMRRIVLRVLAARVPPLTSASSPSTAAASRTYSLAAEGVQSAVSDGSASSSTSASTSAIASANARALSWLLLRLLGEVLREHISPAALLARSASFRQNSLPAPGDFDSASSGSGTPSDASSHDTGGVGARGTSATAAAAVRHDAAAAVEGDSEIPLLFRPTRPSLERAHRQGIGLRSLVLDDNALGSTGLASFIHALKVLLLLSLPPVPLNCKVAFPCHPLLSRVMDASCTRVGMCIGQLKHVCPLWLSPLASR